MPAIKQISFRVDGHLGYRLKRRLLEEGRTQQELLEAFTQAYVDGFLDEFCETARYPGPLLPVEPDRRRG